MVLFANPWIKYRIRNDPFFTEALEVIDDNPAIVNNKNISTLFVGRKSELDYLINLIKRGGGTKFTVIGESGVGKTTTVNYVRYLAKKENYISPVREISINISLIPYKVMVETIILLYDELKVISDLKLTEDLKLKLSHLEPFVDIQSYSTSEDPLISYSPTKLINLFKQITSELKALNYPPVIIHYNNFDKIKDEEKLTSFLHDMREFWDNDHAIFILLGDDLLDYCIHSEDRLRQKFQQPVYLGKLSIQEVRDLLQKRIKCFKIDNFSTVELYDDDVIDILYNLFNGNIREILLSLSFAFSDNRLSNENLPVKLTVSMLRDILSKGVNDRYLSKLTPIQKTILRQMMELNIFTGSQISKIMKKPQQNFSQNYIPKFMDLKMIVLKEIKGNEKFYQVSPPMYWWDLEKSDIEKKKEELDNEQKIEQVQKNIRDFDSLDKKD